MHGTHCTLDGTRGEAAIHGVGLVASAIGEHAATYTGRRCNDQAPGAEAAAYCHTNPNWGAALLSGANAHTAPANCAAARLTQPLQTLGERAPATTASHGGERPCATPRAALVKFAGERGERTIKRGGCIKLLTGGHR